MVEGVGQEDSALKPGKFPIAGAEFIKANAPEHKPPQILKRKKVKHAWDTEQESHSQAAWRAWGITATNPISLVANSSMVLQSLILEIRYTTDERKDDLFHEICPHYETLVERMNMGDKISSVTQKLAAESDPSKRQGLEKQLEKLKKKQLNPPTNAELLEEGLPAKDYDLRERIQDIAAQGGTIKRLYGEIEELQTQKNPDALQYETNKAGQDVNGLRVVRFAKDETPESYNFGKTSVYVLDGDAEKQFGCFDSRSMRFHKDVVIQAEITTPPSDYVKVSAGELQFQVREIGKHECADIPWTGENTKIYLGYEKLAARVAVEIDGERRTLGGLKPEIEMQLKGAGLLKRGNWTEIEASLSRQSTIATLKIDPANVVALAPKDQTHVPSHAETIAIVQQVLAETPTCSPGMEPNSSLSLDKVRMVDRLNDYCDHLPDQLDADRRREAIGQWMEGLETPKENQPKLDAFIAQEYENLVQVVSAQFRYKGCVEPGILPADHEDISVVLGERIQPAQLNQAGLTQLSEPEKPASQSQDNFFKRLKNDGLAQAPLEPVHLDPVQLDIELPPPNPAQPS